MRLVGKLNFHGPGLSVPVDDNGSDKSSGSSSSRLRLVLGCSPSAWTNTERKKKIFHQKEYKKAAKNIDAHHLGPRQQYHWPVPMGYYKIVNIKTSSSE